MRIIAGEARGRKLEVPAGQATRPTADRVRESIFNLLGQRFSRERVLDLFAGSGAMSFEALSRGASHAHLVDQDEGAISVCSKNATALGWTDRVEIIRGDALRILGELEGRNLVFDLVFVDPPYALPPESTLTALGASGLLREGSLVVAEHDIQWTSGERYGALMRVDVRRYGKAAVSLYEMQSEVPP